MKNSKNKKLNIQKFIYRNVILEMNDSGGNELMTLLPKLLRQENFKEKKFTWARINTQQNHAKYSYSIPIVCLVLIIVVGGPLLFSNAVRTTRNINVWEKGFALAVCPNEFPEARGIPQADSMGQCRVHSEVMTSKQCLMHAFPSLAMLSLLDDESVNHVVDVCGYDGAERSDHSAESL